MRARRYCRVSTKEQVEGYSIDAQLTETEKWVSSNSHLLTGEYVDEGRSGGNADRPALQEALREAKAGKYDILVVHKLDRLSRRLLDTLVILGELSKCGVTLVSVTENFDFTTPIGRMFLGMIAMLAEWFLDNLGQEIKKGNREKVRQGYYHGKRVPVGYKRGEDGFLQLSDRWESVKKLFETYATGQHSVRDAKDMALPDLPMHVIVRMMSNRLYTGVVQYLPYEQYKLSPMLRQVEIFPGKHPAIITPEIWQRCQDIMREHSRGGRGVHTKNRLYVFGGGVLKCNVCGHKMQANGQRARAKGVTGVLTYYGCVNQKCTHRRQFVQEAAMLNQMGKVIERIRLPRDWQNRIEKLAAVPNTVATQEKRSKLVEQRRRARVIYANGGITDDAYIRREKDLTAQINGLPDGPASRERLLEAGKILSDLHEIWPRANPEERRTLVRAVFEDITVDVGQRCFTTFMPRQFCIELFKDAGFVDHDGVFEFEKPSLPSRRKVNHVLSEPYAAFAAREDAAASAGAMKWTQYIGTEGVRLVDGTIARNSWVAYRKVEEKP